MLTGFEWKARTFPLGDVAADNDANADFLIYLPAGYQYELSSFYISSEAQVTVQAENIANLTIKTGGGTCLFFYSNNASAGSTISAAEPLAMTQIPQECTIDCRAAATTLRVTHAKAGTGTAMTNVVIQGDIVVQPIP